MYPYYFLWEADFDRLLGDPATQVPILMTEWGWQNVGAGQEVIDPSGTWPQRFKAYLEARPHISWVAWSFSPQYYPRTVTDYNYDTYTQGPDFQGQFMHDYLAEIRDRLQPQR